MFFGGPFGVHGSRFTVLGSWFLVLGFWFSVLRQPATGNRRGATSIRKSAWKETLMATDRYTKAVLTVIAGCLLWLCALEAGRPVQAQQASTLDAALFAGRVQPVVIVGTGSMDAQGKVVVDFVRRNGTQVTDATLPVKLPYTAETPLPVRLPYTSGSPLPAQLFYTGKTPLPVEITGIKKTLDWEPIRTEVEDAPVRRTPGLGPER
jgi:hypothetical protein